MNSKISILHIVNSLDTGGLEKFVIDLTSCTNDIFIHNILCLQRRGELNIPTNINIESLGMTAGLQIKFIRSITSLIRRYNPNIIHTHNEKSLFYGSISGFLSGVPVVHTKHGKNDTTFRSVARNHLLSYLCTKIVSVSNDAAEQCIIKEHIIPSKVLTIHNGVDTDLFTPKPVNTATKSLLGISPDTPVLGIVARLAKIKDHTTLLQACRIIKDSKFNFKLLIVGDGPLMTELVSLVRELNIQDYVIFTGTRPDVSSLMNIIDIFVLSSLSEGISLTLIEAMLSSLPVVATNVGGNPEVVVDGITGYLVPPQNPSLMAERLKELLDNPARRHEFGSMGLLHATQHFSLKQAAKQYEALYKTIARRG
jgi:sugar transferase (PEP-CTERM/EpsH1 system associated)